MVLKHELNVNYVLSSVLGPAIPLVRGFGMSDLRVLSCCSRSYLMIYRSPIQDYILATQRRSHKASLKRVETSSRKTSWDFVR